jgi:uncharacterized membrane protein (DUF4010 family)
VIEALSQEPLATAVRFAAALGLGVLLGLDRERSKDEETGFAGVRTIGLISLAGAIAAYIERTLEQPWLTAATFVAIGSLVTVSYAVSASRGKLGITTELSAILAFLLGYLCLRGRVGLAAGLAVASGGVLALKRWLHALAERIETADVEATLKFAIVSLIVLPLVPNESFGPPPYDVVNPYQIWLMVVLISGLNFLSYLLVKLLSRARDRSDRSSRRPRLQHGRDPRLRRAQPRAARARQSPCARHPAGLDRDVRARPRDRRSRRTGPDSAPRARLGRGGDSVSRVRALAAAADPPCPHGERGGRREPLRARSAIRFGLAFGAITLAAKVAQIHLGETGLYLAGALAGLVDVDAIVLSMASLARDDAASASVAARATMIAVLANTVVKTGMAMLLGAPELRRAVAPAAAATIAAGGAAALLLI